MLRYKYRRWFLIAVTLMNLSARAQQTPSPFDTTIYGKNDRAGRYVHTRGFKMYYESYGKGEPLLLIHGNGGSINNFMYQIPYFAQHYRVIIADSRAHGRSPDDRDSLSYEMMADDLDALLDSLHVDSCHVVGWSDGGINGLLLAIRHPEKVKKLAVTGANLVPDTSAVDQFVRNWVLNYYDSLTKAPQNQQVKSARKLINLLANEPHIPHEDVRSIRCPSLIIGGDYDILLPKHTLLIASLIPRSYLWIVPNSGHSVPVYYRDSFNQIIHDFFKKPYRKIEGFGRFD